MEQASDFSRSLAAWVVGGLQGPSTPPDFGLEDVLMHRFQSAYLVAYLQYAFGTPRGIYAPDELRSWPDLASWDHLLLNRLPDGAHALFQPSFFRHLFTLSVSDLVGSEGRSWHTLRYFFWDARNTLPADPAVSTPTDYTLRGAICEIFASSMFDSDRDNLDTIRGYVTEEMRRVPDGAPPSTAPARPPEPESFPYGVSPRGAEFLVRDWMRHLGIADAEVTQQTSDGGIDVVSSTHVAQVKHYVGSVGGPDIQRLSGAAYPIERLPLFFTSGRYTPAAHAAATAGRVALFTYSAEKGALTAENAFAAELVRRQAS